MMTTATTAEIRTILDNLQTAILRFDGDLRLTYVNPAAEMLFAVSARRLLGRRADTLLPGAPVVEDFRAALTSGHPFTERELLLEPGPERRMTVDLTATPLSEPQRPVALLVEMSQVDRQLRIHREENLLAQSQATRVLLRGLAHEVKNPLGGLRGAAQLLERELRSAELREYTGIIIAEADRLQALVDRMLGPNTVPQRRPVNIHEVLERVRQLVEAERTAGVTLRSDYDPSIPEIDGDPDQLIQALLNIVRNAAQAAASGGTIRLRSRTLRQYTIGTVRHKLVARVDIIDNGPGIPAGMRENIFLPMVSGRPGGSGLGLPIAQSLINQHGGLIECESEPGQTQFTILLPIESEAGKRRSSA